MQDLMIQIMEQYGYLGIFLLIAIENLFPPIPSEVILTFGGFMTTHTSMNPWLVSLFATLGSVVGAVALYLVGRFLNPARLERWLHGRVGRLLRFKPGDVYRASAWFLKHGKGTVFFCRFIPIVRSLISIPAGTARMNVPVFLVLTTLGSFIWNIVLVQVGAWLGESWEVALSYLSAYSHVVVVAIIVLFLAGAYWFYRRRYRQKP